MESEDEFIQQLLTDLKTGELQLPTLPEVALRVRVVVDDENASAKQVSDVVAQDTGVSARLIQVANSPLYRGANEIDRLPMVVARLGSKLVRDLVTGQVMKQMFQATHEAVDQRLRAVWEHSIQVAAIARALAGQCPGIDPDQAMLAGLLHDVGTLPILYRAEEREDLLEVPGLLDHLIEKLHARIGGEMLEQWKFPQQLVEVAAQHENLERSHDGPPDLVDVIQVANLQSHINDGHRLSTVDWNQVSAFQRLGMDVDLNEIELTDRISEIEEVRSLFQ